jgi:hypothetical protein
MKPVSAEGAQVEYPAKQNAALRRRCLNRRITASLF